MQYNHATLATIQAIQAQAPRQDSNGHHSYGTIHSRPCLGITNH